MKIPFWKVESIGNDFPLFHAEDIAPEVLPDLARKASDRRFGIGGDGILVLSKDLVLRMFNPDGTEDFCGNGIRCAAVHAHRQGWAGESFSISHLGRDVPVRLEEGRIFSTIGRASYRWEDIPTTGAEIFDGTVWSGMDSGWPLSLFGSILSTGSTHTIIPIDHLPDDDTFSSVSPKIENDPKFPNRTSVIWRKEIEPMKLEIRIWERGVGETLGCGTGSSAAAADYLRRKGKGGRVEVINPGGTVWVSMESWDGPITVEGTAHELFEGDFRF